MQSSKREPENKRKDVLGARQVKKVTGMQRATRCRLRYECSTNERQAGSSVMLLDWWVLEHVSWRFWKSQERGFEDSL